MKECIKCGISKSLEEYHRNKNKKDGRVAVCKLCANAKSAVWNKENKERIQARESLRFLKRHNLSEDLYREMLIKQDGGKCMICKSVGTKRHVIDHNHKCCPGTYSCGKCIRGLLCNKCNTALGLFDDSIENLKAAIEYLS